ncbi:hypothetical protein [Hymenobacter rubripertinctus]|uniref:Uncharacterized protein n=1 Tax=Hymenobacter rubripertinctus TaxID=2029981 RepID=A0A418R973_9BACT|nr:hypothetical protein [Hymenobacter rubripertinctus]RIY13834.1 hypothetical protein D0T11_01770 [Hymenobacter rubripertinctus]
MQVLDIIALSPQETFLVGYPTEKMLPGPWQLRRNGELVTTVDVTGQAATEADQQGKLAPPSVVTCRGAVDKKQFDFTRDEVTLVRAES